VAVSGLRMARSVASFRWARDSIPQSLANPISDKKGLSFSASWNTFGTRCPRERAAFTSTQLERARHRGHGPHPTWRQSSALSSAAPTSRSPESTRGWEAPPGPLAGGDYPRRGLICGKGVAVGQPNHYGSRSEGDTRVAALF
jgi:hypothetical protein